MKNNVFLFNLMFLDIKMMYLKEFELGVKVLEIIYRVCYIYLFEDEVGYIVLYFVNL